MRKTWLWCAAAVLAAAWCLPAGAQQWREIGPPGGDLRSLVADPKNPSVIYLGTSDGHVFGSTNGGESWRMLGRVGQRSDTVVFQLQVDARDSRVLYAVTYTLTPGGGGIYRSDDSGRTWRVAGLEGQHVRALAQAPSKPDVFVAGTLDGVYRSANGKDWKRISPAGHADLLNFDSVAIDPRDAEVIYAGTYHLAWKTADGGRTWQPIHKGMIDDSDVMDIRIDHTDPSRIYATACSGMYRSANRGELWAKMAGIPSSSRRTHLIRQDPVRANIFYAGTTRGLWRSADGTMTWTRTSALDWSIIGVLIDPRNPDRLVVGVERRGVFVSTDGGRTYRASSAGFHHQQVVSFAVDPARPERMLLVLTNSAEPVQLTTDGGRTWQNAGTGMKVETLRRVYAAPGAWWAALRQGGLQRYDEKTRKWVRAGALPAAVAAPAKAKGKGKAPAKRRAPAAQPFSAVVQDMSFHGELWLAATTQGVFASRDAGQTWKPVPVAGEEKQAAYSVHVAPVTQDGARLLVLGARKLLRSADGGKTWEWHSIPEVRNPRLHVAGEDALFLSSDKGLWVSHDGGRHWQHSTLPDLFVSDLVAVDDVLLAATRRNGLYASHDRGQSWTRLGGHHAESYFPVLARVGSAPAFLAASSTEGLHQIDVALLRALAQGEGAPAAAPAVRGGPQQQ